MSELTPPPARLLRFSHAVLAITAIHQLIGSEWMAKPWRFDGASALQITLFEMHEWAGLAAAAALLVLIVSLFWRYPDATFARFLPWLHTAGRKALAGEVAQLARTLRPPSAQQTAVLAATVQGLGLLTLLFLAGTGTAMWLLEDDLELMHQIGSLHEYGALPLKVYLFGHIGMALIHAWRGEGLLRKMFSPSNG
jgi:cytochrome b561